LAAPYVMHRLIYHHKYSLYNLGENHPFSPLRNEMLIDLFTEIWDGINITEPELISPDEIKKLHSAEYVEAVENCGMGIEVENLERFGLGAADNPAVKGMAEGARWQTSGTLYGAKLIAEGKAKRVLQLGGGFHHAHYNYAAGFCLYNDLALAVKTFTENNWHVLYLDIDVHHGDGVQDFFYSDGQVLTMSFHESGEYLFPGSGWLYQLGQGSGRSLKINFPLEPFTEGESYLYVFKKALRQAMAYFNPDAIVVQAGADAHFSDDLADLMLTTHDYAEIFKTIIQLSEEYANGRMLFTLGGGYSFNASFRVWSILFALLSGKELPAELPVEWRKKWEKKLGIKISSQFHDAENCYEPIPRKEEIQKNNKNLLSRFQDAVAPYWF